MKSLILLAPLLLACAAPGAAQIVPNTLQTTFVQPPSPLTFAKEGTRVAIDGTIAAVVSPSDWNPATASRKPAVRIYHAGTGVLQQTLWPDFFNLKAVAVSGTLVAVGSRSDNEVLVYDLASPTPTVPVHAIHDMLYADPSLALEGTILAVGDGSERQVRIYDLSSGTPTAPIHTIASLSGNIFSTFGMSVDLSGTRLVVGSPGIQTAYTYDLASSTPTTPVHTLNMPPPATSTDEFGESVAILGTKVLVGCRSLVSAGQAFFYDLASPTPTTPVFACQNPDGSLTFGSAVAINTVGLVVGSPDAAGGGTERGRAFGYTFTSNVPAVTYENPTPADGDRFGSAVAASGLRGIIGAPFDDATARDAGSAYAYFTASPTPAVPVATLSTSSPDVDHRLGLRIFFANKHLVAAAPGNTAQVGASGEAVIYVRGTATFSRLASIPGRPLALDDTRLIVGSANSAYDVLVYDLGSATPTIPTHVIPTPPEGPLTGFGTEAAVSGNWLAVGCSEPPPGSPFQRVYVYDLGSASPTQPVIVLRSPDERLAFNPESSGWHPYNSRFGDLLAMDGSRLAVGEQEISALGVPGRIYIFDLAGTDTARVVHTLTPPVGTSWLPTSLNLGQSYNTISMDGGALLVTSNRSQIAHLFDLNGATPTVPVATFTDPADAQYAWMGAISGRRMAISGMAGVRVYDLAGSTPFTPVTTVPEPLGVAGTANGWLAVGLPEDDSAATNHGAVKLYTHATPQAELTVEVDGLFVRPGRVLDFGSVSRGFATPKVITLRNTGNGPLSISNFDLTGAGAARFSVTPGTSITIGGSVPATISLLPGAPGLVAANLAIDDNAFDAVSLGLLGIVRSYSTDSDGDGMSDASEIDLAALGFDWQVAQPTLTTTYNSSANNAGLYTQSQIQALKPGTPLIARNPTTGVVTLTLGLQRSLNLQSFAPFPMAPSGTTLNPQGEIEYRFLPGDDGAFFRLEAR